MLVGAEEHARRRSPLPRDGQRRRSCSDGARRYLYIQPCRLQAVCQGRAGSSSLAHPRVPRARLRRAGKLSAEAKTALLDDLTSQGGSLAPSPTPVLLMGWLPRALLMYTVCTYTMYLPS